MQNESHLTRLQVLLQDSKTLGFLSIICDDSTRASHNLAGLSFLVDFAETSPLTKLLILRHSNQIDYLFGTKCLNQLLVIWLIAIICQDTELFLSTLNRTGFLVETTRESIVGKSFFKHNLNGSVDVNTLSWGSRSFLYRFWAIPSVRHFWS